MSHLAFGTKDEEWTIIAKRTGGGNDFKKLIKYFGTTKSLDEIMARCETRLRFNPEFRKRYYGWEMYPVRIDQSIFIEETGFVRINRPSGRQEKQVLVAAGE